MGADDAAGVDALLAALGDHEERARVRQLRSGRLVCSRGCACSVLRATFVTCSVLPS